VQTDALDFPGRIRTLPQTNTHDRLEFRLQAVPLWHSSPWLRKRETPNFFAAIEQAFAKLKAHLRQRAARTLDELHSALAAALNPFSATHCRGFFRHAQYASI
jgi:hypothetical protein